MLNLYMYVCIICLLDYEIALANEILHVCEIL